MTSFEAWLVMGALLLWVSYLAWSLVRDIKYTNAHTRAVNEEWRAWIKNMEELAQKNRLERFDEEETNDTVH